jgi:hypothetical protein
MKASEFAELLMGVTRRGRDWWADCPNCHQPSLNFRDLKNSLSVDCSHARSDTGQNEVMVVGCSLSEILAAIDLMEVDILSDAFRASLLRRFDGDRAKAQRSLDELREEAALRPRSPRGVDVRRMPPLASS